ncbi:MAG: HAD family hydrolase [Bacteroidota bacterium]
MLNESLKSKIQNPKSKIIFDWGDTLMRDFPDMPGPMAEWPEVHCIPGVEDVLEFLNEKKFVLTVATNAGVSDTALMKAALRRVDIEKYFQFFFSSKELVVSKPDPGFFTEVAARIESDPKSCILIGNDYTKDISAAKKAGMITVFFNEKKLEGPFTDADIVISEMTELIKIFS